MYYLWSVRKTALNELHATMSDPRCNMDQRCFLLDVESKVLNSQKPKEIVRIITEAHKEWTERWPLVDDSSDDDDPFEDG